MNSTTRGSDSKPSRFVTRRRLLQTTGLALVGVGVGYPATSTLAAASTGTNPYSRGFELRYAPGENRNVAKVVQLSGGDYVIVGHEGITPGAGFVTRLDATGTLLWEKKVDHFTSAGYTQFDDCIEVSNQEVVVVGLARPANTTTTSSNTRVGIAYRFDAAGSVVWARQYDSGFRKNGYQIDGVSAVASSKVETALFLGGLASDAVDNISNPWINKIDPATGASFWVRSDSSSGAQYDGFVYGDGGGFGGRGNSPLAPTDDGGVVFREGPIGFNLIKVDSTGTKVWRWSIPLTQDGRTLGIVPSVIQTMDGGFLATGDRRFSGTPDSRDLWLLKIDSTGGKEWEKLYDRAGKAEFGRDSIQLDDGGFLSVAYSFDSQSYASWLVRTDSAGNVVWTDAVLASDGLGTAPTNLFHTSNGGFGIGGTVSSQLTWAVRFEPPAPTDTVPPVIDSVSLTPNPVAVDTSTTLTAKVRDDGPDDSGVDSVEYSIDGGSWQPMTASDGSFDSGNETATASLGPYSSPDVFEVTVRVTDATGNQTVSDPLIFAVYDPDGGFVSGGGWIESPEGAYPANPSLTGKANFGFSSKYKKGASAPTGDTTFKFRAAGLKFESTAYEWLVVSGNRAQFKGDGTLEGTTGDFGFLLTAVDDGHGKDSGDMFRIKIVDKTTDEVVYDNGVDTPLGAGNVIIHADG